MLNKSDSILVEIKTTFWLNTLLRRIEVRIDLSQLSTKKRKEILNQKNWSVEVKVVGKKCWWRSIWDNTSFSYTCWKWMIWRYSKYKNLYISILNFEWRRNIFFAWCLCNKFRITAETIFNWIYSCSKIVIFAAIGGFLLAHSTRSKWNWIHHLAIMYCNRNAYCWK